MKDIYSRIFDKLEKLGVTGQIEKGTEGAKSESKGFMPLSFDRLYKDGTAVVIALAHNYVQNGDVMSDPDMEIKVWPDHKSAEALTFQQSQPPVYQVVYPEPGKVYPKLKKDLNKFLLDWLGNAIDQGHSFK